jgi:hypothetical protein
MNQTLFLVKLAPFAALALLVACGGGGGGGSEASGGGQTPAPIAAPSAGGGGGATAGTLYYQYGSAYRLDLSSGKETPYDLALASKKQLGYSGGDFFTDVEEEFFDHGGSSGGWKYNVNLRNIRPDPLTKRSSLPTITRNISDGRIVGPVQPSPDGKLFAMHITDEDLTSEPLGPTSDFVYVFDSTLKVLFKARNYGDPVWFGNDRIIVVRGDSLYTLTVTASPVATRIGSQGLGKPGSGVGLPAVSPDGHAIAFVQDDSVWRVGLDGSGLTRLTVPFPHTLWTTWSPDGTRLLVQAGVCGIADVGIRAPPIVMISPTVQNQNTSALNPVKLGCGPIYWLP